MIEEAPRARRSSASRWPRAALPSSVPSVETGIALANEFAPEHLTLCVRDAWSKLGQVRERRRRLHRRVVGRERSATTRPARATSCRPAALPASARRSTWTTSSRSRQSSRSARATFAASGPPAIAIAHAEGLHAHAAAIEVRLRELDEHPA